MIFGTNLILRLCSRALAALCITAACIPVSTHAQDGLSYQELSEVLAPRPNVKVAFEETRTLSVLKAPVVMEGWVRFVPPSRFERYVTAPIQERFIIDGDTIVIVDDRGRMDTLATSDHPVLQALADGVRATLLGDLETLQVRFDVAVSGTRENWRIDLTPKTDKLKTYLQGMRFGGTEHLVTEMTIVEANGDVIGMTFRKPGP